MAIDVRGGGFVGPTLIAGAVAGEEKRREQEKMAALSRVEGMRVQEDRLALQKNFYQMKTDTEKQYIQERSSEYQQKRKQIEDAYAGGEGQITSQQYNDAMDRLQKSYSRGDVDVTSPYFSQIQKIDQQPMWTAPDDSQIPMPVKDGVPQPFEAWKAWNESQGKQAKVQEKQLKEREKIRLKEIDERIKAELEDSDIESALERHEYREKRRKELLSMEEERPGGFIEDVLPPPGAERGTGLEGQGIQETVPAEITEKGGQALRIPSRPKTGGRRTTETFKSSAQIGGKPPTVETAMSLAKKVGYSEVEQKELASLYARLEEADRAGKMADFNRIWTQISEMLSALKRMDEKRRKPVSRKMRSLGKI